MKLVIIYAVIALYLGLNGIVNMDSRELEDKYYFIGLVIGGLIWPVSIIIGNIIILKRKFNRKA